MVREADAEAGGGATGLAGEAGIGADDGERNAPKRSGGKVTAGNGGAALKRPRVADGGRIELALDHDESGGSDSKCKIENGKWKIMYVGRASEKPCFEGAERREPRRGAQAAARSPSAP